jgi:hypothetical protein
VIIKKSGEIPIAEICAYDTLKGHCKESDSGASVGILGKNLD